MRSTRILYSTSYYPFGMKQPGRSISSSDYRFGFNDKEKDDETKGTDNSIDFGARIYDPRLVRWSSIDPLAKQFPSHSPYSAFNNNPIYFNDPTGGSAESTIDKKSKTITISAKLILYGDGGNKYLAVTTARDVQNIYNNANGKIDIEGISYDVKFIITGEYRRDGNELKDEISNNTDYRNNYFRVESKTGTIDNTSFTDFDAGNGNSGIFNRDEIKNNSSTTEGHEFGHGLGLEHNSYYVRTIEGQPDIMDTRGDLAQPPYSLPDGALDINKRKVTQNNIEAIFTEDVKNGLSKYGTGRIGKLTNIYHEKPK